MTRNLTFIGWSKTRRWTSVRTEGKCFSLSFYSTLVTSLVAHHSSWQYHVADVINKKSCGHNSLPFQVCLPSFSLGKHPRVFSVWRCSADKSLTAVLLKSGLLITSLARRNLFCHLISNSCSKISISSLLQEDFFFFNESFPQTPCNRKWLYRLGILFCPKARGKFFIGLWDHNVFFKLHSSIFIEVHVTHVSGISVPPPPSCLRAPSWDSIFLPGSRRCPTAPCWSQASPRTILADTHV